MKLLIFGSTGGTGRELVKQALAQEEYTVTAFARRPEALAIKHPRLKVVQGNVTDYASVERAIEGQEAALSALGSPTLKQNTVVSDGTRNIIKAMERFGVKRFICETSLGVGDSQGQLGFLFNRIFLPLFLRHVFADKEIQERLIEESSLDWIIVRPGRLTNGARTNSYRAGFAPTDKTIKGAISRADVADFMLKQLTDNTYLHQTPGISY